MGRYYWDKKTIVEDCRSVSISFMRRHDYFCGYRSGVISWTNHWGEKTSSIGIAVSTMNGENYARLNYTSTNRHTGKKTDYDYKIPLVSTPCNFGGIRWWFICPLTTNGVYCGRRVAKLYCAPGGHYYGCRHCYDLSYDSRNEPRLARPGGIGWPIVVEGRIDRLYKEIKRWTYAEKPTKKAHKLMALQAKCGTAEILKAYKGLFK